MNYTSKVSNIVFKQVEAKGATRAILSISYTTHEKKTYLQDLWVPSSSTSEKATDYYNGVLDTLSLTTEGYGAIYKDEWATVVDPSFVFEIETEIDKRGKEVVKFVNDPANPKGGSKKVTDPGLMSLLGLSEPFQNDPEDEVPF